MHNSASIQTPGLVSMSELDEASGFVLELTTFGASLGWGVGRGVPPRPRNVPLPRGLGVPLGVVALGATGLPGFSVSAG